jgi:hypothetical protein
MATVEEKSERLKKILAGIAKPQKPQKRQVDTPATYDKETEEQDTIDEDLFNKLKMAEEKFNRKKRGLSNKRLKQSSVLTFEEIRELGDSHNESLRTAYFFIFTIITMIASMFCIIGILLISMLVFFADDEI